MPKPKRRKPIVPLSKTDFHQLAPKTKGNRSRHSTRASNYHGCGEKAAPIDGRKRPHDGEDLQPQRKDTKRQKVHADTGTRHRQSGNGIPSGQWRPLSVVHQQAALAVRRLLEADSSRKHGASLKSLTLAPHIEAKKATFAVTCQVLKCTSGARAWGKSALALHRV